MKELALCYSSPPNDHGYRIRYPEQASISSSPLPPPSSSSETSRIEIMEEFMLEENRSRRIYNKERHRESLFPFPLSFSPLYSSPSLERKNKRGGDLGVIDRSRMEKERV